MDNVLHFAVLFVQCRNSQSQLPSAGPMCSLPLPLVFILRPSWPPINKQWDNVTKY